MDKKQIIRAIALITIFCAMAVVLFIENVRPVQVLGLFACGAGVGATLTSLIIAHRTN